MEAPDAPPPPRRDKNRHTLSGHLFLSPWILGFVALTAGPVLASLYLAFTRYNLLSPPSWAGLDNFVRMFSDPHFLNSAQVTIIYVFVSVPLQLALALFLAVVLDKGLRGLAIYRSGYYLPSLLGASVAVAVLWRRIFGYDGLLNGVLDIFGVEPTSWLQNTSTALGTLIVLNVWTFGSPMIIFLAGLRQIPHDLYESALLDGAGAIRRFWSITVPMLTPMIFFNLIIQFINAFQAFTPSYVVSGGTGGPNGSTMFYTLYLYIQGFRNFDMGYAAALGWVLLIAIAVLTAINFIASRYWVFYADEK
ncbi:carbohydrate ABC transporter permease [Bogoriella caseilytica]|uniref:carbohydrate ABC transporter permease n=1 Tax=Bogoriella caseilytica TaxID=56055 RepID=UPI001FE775E0|nr:sugar ABC transporter permease [Bogoriella caseilytica]